MINCEQLERWLKAKLPAVAAEFAQACPQLRYQVATVEHSLYQHFLYYIEICGSWRGIAIQSTIPVDCLEKIPDEAALADEFVRRKDIELNNLRELLKDK